MDSCRAKSTLDGRYGNAEQFANLLLFQSAIPNELEYLTLGGRQMLHRFVKTGPSIQRLGTVGVSNLSDKDSITITCYSRIGLMVSCSALGTEVMSHKSISVRRICVVAKPKKPLTESG